MEAAWIAANVAFGNQEQSQILIDEGILDKIVYLLNSPYEEIAIQSIWCIANISSQNHQNRNLAISLGSVDLLIQAIRKFGNSSILEEGIWALTNLCRSTPLPSFESVLPALMFIC